MTPSPPTRIAIKELLKRALFLRLGLAVLLHFTTGDYTFAPDQETYHSFAAAMANYWGGETFIPPSTILRQGEPPGYYYLVSLLYAVFGAWALIPKCMNALIGALTVRQVFEVTLRMVGDEQMALRASRYTAYFPSLVLWSVLNIRDAWVVFFIVTIVRLAFALQDRPSLRNLVTLGATVLAMTQFRSYLLFAVTLPMVLSFAVRKSRNVLRNLIIGGIVASAVIYADASAGKDRRMRYLDLEDLNKSRKWSSGAAASGFAQDVDISTPDKALAFLPIGLAYFLLAPFPWTVVNLRQGFTIPEMLFFYSLIPSLIYGVGHLMRNHLGSSLMLVLMTAGITFGYAVGQGNVGTIYRHRAQVLPCFLVFAAVGVEARRAKHRPARVARPSLARAASAT